MRNRGCWPARILVAAGTEHPTTSEIFARGPAAGDVPSGDGGAPYAPDMPTFPYAVPADAIPMSSPPELLGGLDADALGAAVDDATVATTEGLACGSACAGASFDLEQPASAAAASRRCARDWRPDGDSIGIAPAIEAAQNGHARSPART